MFGFNRIQRYVLSACAAALVLVLGVIALAILIVDVVEQLRTVGARTDITLLAALTLSLMKLPMLMQETLPFAVLAAAMIAFNQLSRRAELPVFRASGVSAWRFTAPAMVLAAMAGVLASALLNPIGAALNEAFEDRRAALLAERRPDAAADQTIWFRDVTGRRQTIIRAAAVSGAGTTLEDVVLVEQARVSAAEGPEAYRFSRRIVAERATLANGFWRLEDYTITTSDGDARAGEGLSMPSETDPNVLLERFASPRTIGFWSLPRSIRLADVAGLDASRYAMRWHELLAAPVKFAAMALIGAIAFLNLARLGGTTRRAALGLAAGLGLYFVTQLGASLAASGALPTLVAAWTPPVGALLSCFVYLAFREDG